MLEQLKEKLGKQPVRGHMPVKRTINLANVGEKPISVPLAVFLSLVVIIAAGMFSKVAVIDRFLEVDRLRRENYRLEQQIQTVEAEIETYRDVAEEYAHYTYQDFTEDELSQADRSKIIDLIRLKVNPMTPVSSWRVTGNQLNLSITGYSLESVNNMVLQLQEDDLVDYCSVSAATQASTASGNLQTEMYVSASIQVYLKSENRGLSAQ